MDTISRRNLLASLAVVPAALRSADEGWTPLFDGKSLEGWTPSENKNSWKVVDGMLAGDGPRSHLFYTGPVRGAAFKNFEFKADVMTRPQCNSGIYFHTRFQPSGFPRQGFEVQINNSALGEGSYRERKKTGSLYGVRNVYKAFARDNEWFQIHVTVRGKQVQVRLNGVLLVDYIEPDPPVPDPDEPGRILTTGTFAFQCHDPGSKVFYRNILVRPLPDDLVVDVPRPVVDDTYRRIRTLSSRNYPVVDYHVHLKGGWTLEQALRYSREVGIGYGIAVNCGVGFPITDDAAAEQFLKSMEGQPVYVAMQAEGREWVKMFSPQTIAKFDYVFTDSMTFSHNGRRIRLWIPKEVGPIEDKEAFMDVIVDRTVGVLLNEPIDIYVNPTFLPRAMEADYDRLWTPERMERVIAAAKKNDVAIEINNRYRIPSAKFIKAAKAAGLKFSFGTNNDDSNIGRLEYALEMVEECGLGWQDIFVPKPDGEKPVQKRGLPKA
ncbi:MAG: family 16 glycoside hydrolase [Rhodospirillales bacterium]